MAINTHEQSPHESLQGVCIDLSIILQHGRTPPLLAEATISYPIPR